MSCNLHSFYELRDKVKSICFAVDFEFCQRLESGIFKMNIFSIVLLVLLRQLA